MARWINNPNIEFVGRRRAFWTLSTIAVLASIGVLVANVFIRGSALNYGTDFKGGTQIQVEFSKAVKAAEVRRALVGAGYKGGEVVRMEDESRPHLFMLRLTEVSAFSKEEQATAKKVLHAAFPGRVKGVDYKGEGDRFYVRFNSKQTIKVEDKGRAIAEKIAKTLKDAKLEVGQTQLFGRAQDRIFQVVLGGLSNDLSQAFEKTLGKGSVKDIPQVESVGAKMGRQLRDDGVKSVIYALLLMLVYIALRFDFRYAPGAVVALAHDVIITTGLFAIAWVEFSLPVVAALLTISGYSINDTIVVYDRIRENVARMRDRKFPMVVNSSINETLSRTLLTSITTLFTCVAIWVVGTGVLKTFAFALTAGVVVGTYSSVFIASPLVVLLNERFTSKKKARAR